MFGRDLKEVFSATRGQRASKLSRDGNTFSFVCILRDRAGTSAEWQKQ